jgi:hypothetical protein
MLDVAVKEGEQLLHDAYELALQSLDDTSSESR